MKTITLINSAWFRSLPAHERRQLLRNIFDLADQTGWQVRVAGQHW